MKKNLIISGIVILLFTTAFAAVHYYFSFHEVTISLADDVKQATVFHSGKKTEPQTIASTTTLRLQDGSYSVVPKGDHVVTDDIPFTVKGKDETITIDPDFTSAYLSELLAGGLPSITTAMKAELQPVINQYDVAKPSLYSKGEWFGALLEKRVSDPRNQQDYYRVVMKKQGSTWKLVQHPELILTSTDFPGVPSDILRKINALTQ